MVAELEFDPVSIDVGHLVRRNVASLYSSLVTRPTGQAVRLAIENVLAEETRGMSLSVVDMSQVTIIDFSCADEVVAKLLIRYGSQDRPREAYFVFRGIKELHRDPIEVVLKRHSLAAVAEIEAGRYRLLGDVTEAEETVFSALEGRGAIPEGEADDIVPGGGALGILRSLVQRRTVFRSPLDGSFCSLSHLLSSLA